LRFYYELWEDFDRIDVDNERRISEKEFTTGYHILNQDYNLKITNPHETFEILLKKYNAQAHITFTEFCDYVISERLKLLADSTHHNSF
jgi:Ca2+-binding EF-hand superfamily protein